ncbi:MAG TPA: peptidyl-prolyl cis-trans isomerase [Alphaproteobacteria bacterium]|nr:peptidyl-prolyl cis-trans isomerase [Alphaproteobacteria bacterium]
MIRFLQSGNRAVKYVLGGFLVVICVSMVVSLVPGFGSSSSADTNRAGIIATVGGQDILTADVVQQVTATQQQQRYPDMLRPLIARNVIQQMITRAEIRYQAERMGLGASDKEVENELRTTYAQYFFPNGAWIGQDKYQQLIAENANTTVAAFENSLRMEIMSRKLLTTVVAGLDVPASEIEKTYKDQNTKVKFDYAVISLEDVKKGIKPTDVELRAFFARNGARYENSIPEKRQLRYFVLDERMAREKTTVSAEDIQRYYDSHQDQYRVPDRFKSRHILITTPAAGPDGKVDQKAVDAARAKAEDILKQVKAGADFAELANKYSGDPGNRDPKTGKMQGGELGWVSKGQFVPEFEKAALGQEKGQISDLVQSNFGFHIIQTEDKQIGHLPPLAEVKSRIEPLLKQEKTSTLLLDMAKDSQSIAQSQGIEKAAAKYGVPVVQSNPVARTDSLPGAGQSPQLMNDIFNVPEKSGPQVARTAQGFALFEVTKIVPPRTPTFDEIKGKVADEFKNERATELVSKRTAEMADRAHNAHDLRKAAKELGATVKTSELVTRSSTVPDIGSMGGGASVAFTLKPGQISGAISAGVNGAVLMVTESKEPALSGPDYERERDSIRDQLMNQKRQQAIAIFMSNLDARLVKEGKVKHNKTEEDNLTKPRG